MTIQRSRMTGAAELDKVLQQLPVEVAKKVLRGAVMSGAGVVVSEARLAAPRRTGKLIREIRRKLDKQSTHSVTVQVGVGKAFYGLFQEFGTRFMPARPWFRPAWEASKMAALNQIGRALGRGIEDAAVRLAGRFSKSGLASRNGVVSRAARFFGN